MSNSKSKLKGDSSKRTIDLGTVRIKRMRLWAAQMNLKGTTRFERLDDINNALVDAQLKEEKIPHPEMA